MQNALLFIIFVTTIVGLILYFSKSNKTPHLKFEYIDKYNFPKRVTIAILKNYPHLTNKDANLVLKALKDYFKIALLSNGKMVYMPSRVVDVAWHEFLLFTKEYEKFSIELFGNFFHHYPAESMNNTNQSKNSIDLTYKLASKIENIDPKYPSKLPLIFAIDEMLNIKDGYKYNLKTLSRYKQTNNSCSCGGSSSCGGDYSTTSHDISHGADSCGGASCGGGCGGA